MPIGNRLSDMAYDEVSLVDAGANNDDVEGAHVLLMKRDYTEDEIADFSKAASSSTSTKSTKKSSSKQKGTSQRSANWDESRHPRVTSGPGGGEFTSTSAQSKKKYGKGGTAIDNLPKGYQTTNKTAAKLGLEHGITAAQAKTLPKAGGSGSGGGKGKAKGKGKKGSGGSTKLTPQQKQARKNVALINGLAANQRAALRASNKPIPAGYQWNSNDRLVNSANVAAKNKLARSLGLPTAQVSSKKAKAKTGKKKVVTGLVMDSHGHIHRVTQTVKTPAKKKAAAPAKKAAKPTQNKKRPPKKTTAKKRGAVKKNNTLLSTWLYGERSAAS